jgi:1-acyl-sn-glycerol-3-phosphate acyltransferase
MGLNRFGGGAGGLKYLLATLLFQAYPFPQATAYRASLEYTGELLDAGKWVLIFPEGRVAPERSMRRFRGGVGALAENTGAPVYPVAISGVRDLFNEQEGEKDDAGSGNAAEKREIKKGEPGRTSGRKRRILPRRSRVRVAFGPPLYYEQGEEYDDFAARVRARVEELLEAGKPSA